jgi:hypothetical protein
MDMKARIDKYNIEVGLISAEKAKLGATVDILKIQVLDGFKVLSESLGETVNKKTIIELKDREERRILELLEKGETALARHKSALDSLAGVQIEPRVERVQVDTPVQAPTPKPIQTQKYTETAIPQTDKGDDFLKGITGIFEEEDYEL